MATLPGSAFGTADAGQMHLSLTTIHRELEDVMDDIFRLGNGAET